MEMIAVMNVSYTVLSGSSMSIVKIRADVLKVGELGKAVVLRECRSLANTVTQ